MEDLVKKAENYAEGKVNEVLTLAIEQAYIDGYRDGYKDCEEEISVDLSCEEVEYVDLGLPSGTLWAKDYMKEENGNILLYMTHGEANCLNIPTQEQWDELKRVCVFEKKTAKDFQGSEYLTKLKILAPNGAILIFDTTGYFTTEYKHNRSVNFWLKDDSEESFKKNAVKLDYWMKIDDDREIEDIFCGYKLPVRLVKQK